MKNSTFKMYFLILTALAIVIGNSVLIAQKASNKTIRNLQPSWAPLKFHGGPLFYGHAVEFNERPDHPGNVWWHQSRLASKVYRALDGKQQEIALVKRGSPADRAATIQLKGPNSDFAGIPVSELSKDQKELVEHVLRSLLEPYRASDVEEVMTALKANGGLEKLYISFYEDGDLPDKDGIWDRWKLEGPAFVWYFRGSPHVHTWINIGHKTNVSS